MQRSAKTKKSNVLIGQDMESAAKTGTTWKKNAGEVVRNAVSLFLDQEIKEKKRKKTIIKIAKENILFHLSKAF